MCTTAGVYGSRLWCCAGGAAALRGRAPLWRVWAGRCVGFGPGLPRGWARGAVGRFASCGCRRGGPADRELGHGLGALERGMGVWGAGGNLPPFQCIAGPGWQAEGGRKKVCTRGEAVSPPPPTRPVAVRARVTGPIPTARRGRNHHSRCIRGLQCGSGGHGLEWPLGGVFAQRGHSARTVRAQRPLLR